MVRHLLLSSVALAVISSSAFAADLPSRRAPAVYVPPVPVFSWTGLYIGGDAGYSWGRDTSTASAFFPGVNTINTRGFVGGAHIGYNFAPWIGGFVFGAEADVDGSSVHATGTFNNGAAYSTATPIQGSIRGRVGFAVDRALFYATGGAAFGSFTNNYSTGDQASTSRVGYTVGGGIEYAIMGPWSVRAEYRYTNFGTLTDTLAGLGGSTFNHREIENRATFGFSYKFDGAPVPVVAKY